MRSSIIILSLAILSFSSVFSQRNVIKLHLESIAYQSVNVGFERAIKDKVSLGFNFGYLFPREIPEFIYTPSHEDNYVDVEELKNNISGTTFVPEIRLYPGLKGAPKFFYIGLYGKFNNFNLALSETFKYNFSNEEYNDLDPNADYYPYVNQSDKSINATTEFELKLRQIGIGAQLGVQFPIGKRVTIDWGIAGLGYNFFKAMGKYSVVDVPVDYSRFIDQAEENINTNFEDVPFINGSLTKLTDEGNSIKASLPFSSAGFRTYLSLGVRF